MKITRRFLALILSLSLVIGMMPGISLAVFAEETTTEEAVFAETTAETTAPEETVPETTVPETTAPEETVPETAVPETTAPEETVPETTVPEETEPVETEPEIALFSTGSETEQYLQDQIDAGNTEIFVDQDITLENTFTLPVGLSLIIKEDCTLTIPEGKRFVNNSPIAVYGTIANHNRMEVKDTIEFTEYGSYTGNGIIRVDATSVYPLDFALQGLDLSGFEVNEGPGYWDVHNVDGLPRLGTPTDLYWENGYACWTMTEPHEFNVRICLYQVGVDAPISISGCGGWGDSESHLYNMLNNVDLSGDYSYYFTVEALSSSVGYGSSEPAVSEVWTPTPPEAELGACTDVSFDGQTVTWNGPEDADENTQYEVRFLYITENDGIPSITHLNVGSGAFNGSFAINEEWGYFYDEFGIGNYVVDVRALSDNVLEVAHGPWTSSNEVYYDGSQWTMILTATEQYLQDQIDAGNTEIFVDQEIVLENDFEIPANIAFTVNDKITVPAGVTLTVNSGRFFIHYGGLLHVEEGGHLVIGNIVSCWNGASMVIDGTYEFTNEWAYIIVNYESGVSADQFSGIADEDISLRFIPASEEELQEAAQVMETAGFGNYIVLVHDSLTLTEDFTIPGSCTFTISDRGSTVTISEGVTLTNYGQINVNPGETLQNNGTIKNNGIFANSGVVINDGEVQNSGQLYNHATWQGNDPVTPPMSQDDLEAALDALEPYNGYWLNQTVTLERDMTVPENKYLGIGPSGKLIVPEGITLTAEVNINVNAGGTLEVNGEFVKAHEEPWLVSVGYENGTLGNITGIDRSNIALDYYIYDPAYLMDAEERMAEWGFGWNFMYQWVDVTLTEDVTIPENTFLHLYGGSTLTVPEGVTLTNNGELYVWDGQSIVNNGTIENNGFFGIWGTLTNSSTINVNDYLMVEVPGTVENNGDVYVNGGYDVFGTWEGNDPIRTYMTQADLEAALSESGENGFDLTVPVTLEWDMTLTEDQSLYIGSGGCLTVPEDVTLTVEGLLNVMNSGTLDVQGEIDCVNSIQLLNYNGTSGVVNGVPNENIFMNYNVLTVEQMEFACQQLTDEGYSAGTIYPLADMTLTENLTLPVNSYMHIVGGNTLTIDEGAQMTINGDLYVWEDQSFVNNGRISVNRLLYVQNGTLTNNGLLDVSGGTVAVPGGTLENNGGIQCRQNGTIEIEGAYVSGENSSAYIWYHDGEMFGTITGISEAEQTLIFDIYSEDQLLEAMEMAAEGTYKCYSAEHYADITLTEDLVIPENCDFYSAYGNLTIEEGVEVTVNGSFNIYTLSGDTVVTNNGTIINNTSFNISEGGTIQNNGAFINNGTIENNGNWLGNPAAAATEQYLQDQIDAGSSEIIVDKDTVITKDFALPDSVSVLMVNANITVAEGVTFSIRGVESLVNPGGSMVVEEGAHLDLGALYLGEGCTVEINGTYECAQDCYFFHYYVGDTCTTTISGVAAEDMAVRWFNFSQEEFEQALQVMNAQEYAYYIAWVHCDLNISEEITIPENCDVCLAGEIDETRTFIVDENGWMTVNGSLNLTHIDMISENNGWIENNGRIFVDGTFTNNSTIINYGTLHGYAAIVNNGTINNFGGTVEVRNSIAIGGELYCDNGGTIEILGTYELIDEPVITATHTDGEMTSTIIGIPESVQQLSFGVYDEDQLLEALEIMAGNEYKNYILGNWSEFTITEDITIPENCTLQVGDFVLTLGEDATMTNCGTINNLMYGMKLDGTVENQGTFFVGWDVYLENNGTLTNDGTFTVFEQGTVQNNGTFINNAALENNGNWYGNPAVSLNETYLQAQIDAGETEIVADIDLTFGNSFTVPEGVTLTVEEGVTLSFAECHLNVMGTLENNGIINIGSPIQMTEDGWYQFNSGLMVQGTMVNNGEIFCDESAQPSNWGTWEGDALINAPISQDVLETNLEYTGDMYYELLKPVTLERDMVVSNPLCILEYGSLIVPEGITLTVEDIENRWAIRVCGGGILDVQGEMDLQGDQSVLAWYSDSYNSDPVINGLSNDQISNMNMLGSDIQDAVDFLGDHADYAGNIVSVLLAGETVLNEDLTLRAGDELEIAGEGTLTIPENVTLTVNGTLAIYRSDITVINNGTVINQGTIINEGTWEGNTPIRAGDFDENVSWQYEEATGAMTITGTGSMYPNGINWFKYMQEMVSLVISEGITNIPNFAFEPATKLSSVDIADSVTEIGYKAFYCCTSLESLELPKNLSSISEAAFVDSGITELTFTGDAPVLMVGDAEGFGGSFTNITATAYYPADNATWTEEFLSGNYGGNITWVPYGENVPAGIITDTGRTLSLSGVIFINQYIKPQGFKGVDIAANGGMLIWNSPVTEEDAVFGNEEVLVEGLLDAGNGEYAQQTPGIAARAYADDLYIRMYIKDNDGNYVYGPLVEYSVRDYCEGRLEKSSNTKLKNTCAELLHYGAAAQTYFGYNTDDLANANIADTWPQAAWDASLLDELTDPVTDIVGTGTVTDNGKTLSLAGAIQVNFYVGLDSSVGTPATAELLFWDGVDGTLTLDNVSYKKDLIADGDEFAAQSDMFAAREYGKTIYACAHFVDAEGNDHYSDVIPYSAEEYAAGRIEKSSNAKLVAAMKAMVIYGEAAKNYFA